MRRHLLVGMAGLLALGGCAGMSPTQVGQTTGSIAGAAIIPGIGMPIGALLGTLAGLVVEQQLDKVREQKERLELGQQLEQAPGSPPALEGTRTLEPSRRVWVDEQLQDGRLIAGHFEGLLAHD